MPQNTSPETEIPNVGPTPTSTPPTQPSDGLQESMEMANTLPEFAAPGVYPSCSLDEQWNNEAEQEQLQRELRSEQNKLEYASRPPPPVPSERVLELARALGLENTKWTADKIRQMESFDHLSTIPVVVGVLLVTGLDSIAQCEKAYKVLGEIAENPKSSDVVRTAAVKALAETVKAHQAMSAHALSLAKETQSKKNGHQPKFLPPSLALQINCSPGAPAPSVQVASVNSGQEQTEPHPES